MEGDLNKKIFPNHPSLKAINGSQQPRRDKNCNFQAGRECRGYLFQVITNLFSLSKFTSYVNFHMKHFSHLFFPLFLSCAFQIMFPSHPPMHTNPNLPHSGPENSFRDLFPSTTTVFYTVRLTICAFHMTLNDLSPQSIIYFCVGISFYN